MKLHVIEQQRFTCASCTRCCRDWHVQLDDAEAKRIADLPWPEADPLHGHDVIQEVQGRPVLVLESNGACIFLNESNGYCRIQEQFDFDSKPLGCRLFPFQISPTFPGEATVTGRFDCPTIRANQGASFESQRGDLKHFSRDMKLRDGIDEAAMLSLSRSQVELIAEYLATLLGTIDRDPAQALFLVHFADWLETQSAADIDRESLGELFPLLKQHTHNVIDAAADRSLPRVFRMSFRSLLSAYLRRDEDVTIGRASRLGRLFAVTAVSLGGGRLDQLGHGHPRASLRQARLFKEPHRLTNADDTALLWRMIRLKLQSLQFLGSANHGRDLTDGLRSLALLYPLTIAVAKAVSAARDSDTINANDVDCAVDAIEHSFGRSPLLSLKMTRNAEAQLTQSNVFALLVAKI